MNLRDMGLSPGLREALRSYCREALAIVAVRLGTALPPGARDDWLVRFYELQSEFDQLDSYLAADRAMRADPTVARHLDTLVGTEQARLRVDTKTFLRVLLFGLLDGQENAVFDEAQFDRIFREVEDYFDRMTEHLLFVAPLQNFKMALDRIELGAHFALVKLTETDVQSLKQEIQGFAAFVGGAPLTGFEECAFELHLDVPRILGSVAPSRASVMSDPADEEIGEALSALRLFKPGSVGYTFVRITRIGWSPTPGTQWHWSHEGEVRRGPQYELSADEARDFVTFWDSFRSARKKKRPRVTLALRRFNFAYGRLRPEDRLIDHAIALEALLLKRGETQELKYRLALRGSFLLGSSSEERIKAHALLSKAYDERSNIAHGGEVPPEVISAGERLPFHSFVEMVEEVVRAAIRGLLVCNDEETDVLDQLDARVLRGG